MEEPEDFRLAFDTFCVKNLDRMSQRATGRTKIALKSTAAPTFVDIFAGCGGLSLGLLQAGWNGLFAIEQEQNAFSTLKTNLLGPSSHLRFSWPHWLPQSPSEIHAVLKTYRKQLDALSGTLDAVVGGPPCQGFSNAGKRDHNDPRNQLIKAYLSFVEILQPRLIIIENVKGITSDFKDTASKKGTINYAEWLTSSLSQGYSVSQRIINTALFGVPQRRQRFVIIAVRRDLSNPHEGCPFTLIERMRPAFLKSKGLFSVPIASRSAISDLEVSKNGSIPSVETKGFQQIAYRGPRTTYQRLMRNGMSTPPTDTRLARHAKEIQERFQRMITICHSDGRLNTSLSAELKASFGLKKSAIRVLDPDDTSPTITSMPDDLIHYSEPRALTVRENARLQSFPDWFQFKGKYTTGGHRRRKEIPRFTQVANAVPPLLAEAFGIALTGYLQSLTKA